jgi:hypothetical protein
MLKWGTFGKGGVEHCAGTCQEHPLRWKLLTDCDTEHLQTILRTQRQVYDTDYAEAIRIILVGRGAKPNAFSRKAERELFDAIDLAIQRVASKKIDSPGATQ